MVRKIALRSAFPSIPLHLCLFFIYFWFFPFSSSDLVSLPSLPFRLRFFVAFFPCMSFSPEFPPRTKPINNLTSLFFRFHTYVSMKARPPQILSLVMSYLTLPLSTYTITLALAYFPPSSRAGYVHISPFSRCNSIFLFAIHSPIDIQSRLLICIRLSFLFPFVNPTPLARRQSGYSRSLGTSPGGCSGRPTAVDVG